MYNSGQLWHMPYAWPPSYGTQWARESPYQYPVPNLFAHYQNQHGQFVSARAPVQIQPYFHLPETQSAQDPLHNGYSYPPVLAPPILSPVGLPSSAMSGSPEQDKLLQPLLQAISDTISENPNLSAQLTALRNDLLPPSLTPEEFERILRLQVIAGDANVKAALDKNVIKHYGGLGIDALYQAIRKAVAEGGSGMSWTAILALMSIGVVGVMLLILWALKPVNVYKSGALI